MEIDPGDLLLFARIVECGSFSLAAERVQLPKSTVSRRITLLEGKLGERLLQRTTRRVNITADGETAFTWAQTLLGNVDDMLQALSGVRNEPRGALRISTSLRLGREYIAPVMARLRQRYPALEVWLELLDRRADLIAENFDIDIRVGEVLEQHLIAHRITTSYRILCAAPAYLERMGAPRSLAELAQHDCLLFRERDQRFGLWRLHGANGEESVKVTGPMASNHSDVVRQWAHEGYGIIMASMWDVAASLKAGELVQVLPGYRQPADVWAVTTARGGESEKIRVCIEFLKQALTQGPQALVTRI
ncbi:LysR family transcriptional regulator [Pseudomonas sp.]|uniref:LysR family transcriptional regulator n=1 Tax=Pseudomonas sp. TaxID=306 RepID=UPI002585D124|nr:LysR family transcriptional regulator [Pseudomonas sp.]